MEPIITPENVKFFRLTSDAIIPCRAYGDAAGLDLFTPNTFEIEPYERKLIKTNLQVLLPKGCYGRIASRSGLSLNKVLYFFLKLI